MENHTKCRSRFAKGRIRMAEPDLVGMNHDFEYCGCLRKARAEGRIRPQPRFAKGRIRIAEPDLVGMNHDFEYCGCLRKVRAEDRIRSQPRFAKDRIRSACLYSAGTRDVASCWLM